MHSPHMQLLKEQLVPFADHFRYRWRIYLQSWKDLGAVYIFYLDPEVI